MTLALSFKQKFNQSYRLNQQPNRSCMAHQVEEDGWPLGLQRLNMRSVSFNTMLTGSRSSSSNSHSSTDLDTESTGSFFHDRSVTLGNLMGISSIVELSRRSLRRGKTLTETLSFETKRQSNPKSKLWCFGFCLCQRDNGDVVDISGNHNIVPLGHFLEAERRAAQDHRQGQHSPLIYGADELASAQPFGESSNSLFMDGAIMPPTRLISWSSSNANGRRAVKGLRTPCF